MNKSLVARMAGNILSGVIGTHGFAPDKVREGLVKRAVEMAIAVEREVEARAAEEK